MFQDNNEILYDKWLSDTLNTNCYSYKSNTISDYTELKSNFKFNHPYFVSIKTFENADRFKSKETAIEPFYKTN
jgi:hypothetical protein